MKRFNLLFIIFIIFLLQSCKKEYFSTSGSVKLNIRGSEDFSYDYNYSDSFFIKDDYNIDLARISLISSLIPSEKVKEDFSLDPFYKQIGFDDYYISKSFNEPPSFSSCAFIFTHKKIDDFDLVNIAVRGHNYTLEWFSNLDLGENLIHKGFDESSRILIKELDEYLSRYDINHLKLWFTGYSRAGAISNLCAKHYIDLNYNVYCYTFESPNNTQEEKLDYNIYNLYNTNDLVTMIPPTNFSYNIYGKRIKINNIDYNELNNKQNKFKLKDIDLYEFSLLPILFKTDFKKKNESVTLESYFPKIYNLLVSIGLDSKAHYNEIYNNLSYIAKLFIINDIDIKNLNLEISDFWGNHIGEKIKGYLDKSSIEYDSILLNKGIEDLNNINKKMINNSNQENLDTIITLYKNIEVITFNHLSVITYLYLN
jgi:hypothetical protein